ncbi:3-keto-5-aminohexanoate cleavage protein [Streptomyces tubercidicus]|nr:3-keto-5-aminohexanoate cleavage protein [Streptomyces tubercidicus]WAU16360.1 3-keto-5-aminohexanoate cleavage protein [Streptomyces tubercidicus]
MYSGTDAASRLRASPFVDKILRVLAEVVDTNPHTASATTDLLLRDIGTACAAPILLHGEDGSAWPVLRVARRLGLATRIGFEDVLHTPDGIPAPDNAALVKAAALLR